MGWHAEKATSLQANHNGVREAPACGRWRGGNHGRDEWALRNEGCTQWRTEEQRARRQRSEHRE
eukprot:4616864-Alexandrium_andersonii.AAC.1